MQSSFPRVKLALVATWADTDPTQYNEVLTWLSGRFSVYYQVKTVGMLTAADTAATFAGDREELLQAAFALGERLVEE